jgi:hypothetical protein
MCVIVVVLTCARSYYLRWTRGPWEDRSVRDWPRSGVGVCLCGVVFKCQTSVGLWKTLVRFLLQHRHRLCLLRVKTWHLSFSGTSRRWKITRWTLTIATARDPWYMDHCLIVSKTLCCIGNGVTRTIRAEWSETCINYIVKSMLRCRAERSLWLHYGLRPFVYYNGVRSVLIVMEFYWCCIEKWGEA